MSLSSRPSGGLHRLIHCLWPYAEYRAAAACRDSMAVGGPATRCRKCIHPNTCALLRCATRGSALLRCATTNRHGSPNRHRPGPLLMASILERLLGAVEHTGGAEIGDWLEIDLLHAHKVLWHDTYRTRQACLDE